MQSVRQISNQRGGSVRALVPDVLRIRQGAPCVALSCLLCCVLLLSSAMAPLHGTPPGVLFHGFSGRYFAPRRRGQILHFTG